jgi:hypothetical protein
MARKKVALLVSFLLALMVLSGCVERPAYWGIGNQGIFGSVFLSEGDTLVIEVDWVYGVEPDRDALGNFSGEVENITDKEVEIDLSDLVWIDSSSPIRNSLGDYRLPKDEKELMAKIKDLGEGYRDHNNALFPTLSDTIYLYVIYLDGIVRRDDSFVPGMVFSPDAICIFPKVLDNLGASGQRQNLEVTILLHEFGHLLGLANRPGLEEYQNSEQLKNHCSNPSCVMFWNLTWGNDNEGYDDYKKGYKTLCGDCQAELDSYRY